MLDDDSPQRERQGKGLLIRGSDKGLNNDPPIWYDKTDSDKKVLAEIILVISPNLLLEDCTM